MIAEHDCFACIRERYRRYDFVFECHHDYLVRLTEEEIKNLSEMILAQTRLAWQQNLVDPLSELDILALADSLSRLFIYLMNTKRRRMGLPRYIKRIDIKDLVYLFHMASGENTRIGSMQAGVVAYIIDGKMRPLPWCWTHRCLRRR